MAQLWEVVGANQGMAVYLIHDINLLNAELNPIRHLLALVGARHIVHVSRIRVKSSSQIQVSDNRYATISWYSNGLCSAKQYV